MSKFYLLIAILFFTQKVWAQRVDIKMDESQKDSLKHVSQFLIIFTLTRIVLGRK
ncbi:hypothetical protein [Litoribacter populi]|uniref:hypothetical protein n=1 Tax=Litoribacter populi TaxID=2598460 RepID=UPI00163DC7F0|nr:hypothetical protein [Litoribacter populi]